MTDLNPAASPAATVLAASFTSPNSQVPCAPYHGMLTPVEFDARRTEIAALAFGAALHDLGWLRRIAVRGSDRFRWLNGMVTNMVKDLPSGTGASNLVLNAQGRIQGDLNVWRESDDLDLEVTFDQADKLLTLLDRFIIMDDVELAAVEGETAVGLSGPGASEVLSRLGLPMLNEPMTQTWTEWNGPILVRREFGVMIPHYAIWVPATEAPKLWQAMEAVGTKPVGAAAIEAFRIAEGIPVYGTDIVERDLPQETSQMRALHFDKGCYIGQEIVERIRSRGNIHRHLRLLELSGPLPEPGTKLTLDGNEAGHVTSATELPLPGIVRRFALGMIRGEADARMSPLTYSSGEAIGTAQILNESPALKPGVER